MFALITYVRRRQRTYRERFPVLGMFVLALSECPSHALFRLCHRFPREGGRENSIHPRRALYTEGTKRLIIKQINHIPEMGIWL